MSSPITHFLWDIETLGLHENAVVTSLAVVPFQFETYRPYPSYVRDGLFVKFDIPEQIKKYQRGTDASTLQWWKEQSKEAKQFSITPSAEDVDLKTGLDLIRQWIQSVEGHEFKKSYHWSRGNDFDFPKISSLHEYAGVDKPFNDRRIRDVRTYVDILTGVDNGYYTPIGTETVLKEFVAHHALHDAAKDAYCMVEIYLNNIGELPPF